MKPLVRDVPQPKVLPPYAGPPDKSPEFGGASIQTLGHGSGGVRKGVGWVTTDILCISVLFFGRVRSQSRADPLWIPLPLQAPPTTVHPVPQPLTNTRTSGDSRWSPSSTETRHQAHQRRDNSTRRDGDPTRLLPAHEALRSSLRRADSIRRGVRLRGAGRLGLLMG